MKSQKFIFKPRWSINRIYLSNTGWAKGRSQRDELEIQIGKGILKLGPSNFGNSCFYWRDSDPIPLAKLVKALDDAFPKAN